MWGARGRGGNRRVRTYLQSVSVQIGDLPSGSRDSPAVPPTFFFFFFSVGNFVERGPLPWAWRPRPKGSKAGWRLLGGGPFLRFRLLAFWWQDGRLIQSVQAAECTVLHTASRLSRAVPHRGKALPAAQYASRAHYSGHRPLIFQAIRRVEQSCDACHAKRTLLRRRFVPVLSVLSAYHWPWGIGRPQLSVLNNSLPGSFPGCSPVSFLSCHEPVFPGAASSIGPTCAPALDAQTAPLPTPSSPLDKYAP